MQRRKSGLTNLGTFLVRVQAVRQATPGVTGSSRARDQCKSIFRMRETYLHNAYVHLRASAQIVDYVSLQDYSAQIVDSQLCRCTFA